MVFLLIFIGIILYSFIEYWHHKWAGHLGTIGKKHLSLHLNHHKDPLEGGLSLTKRYITRIPTIFLLGIPIVLTLLLVTNVLNSLLVFSGVLLAYLYSEYIHYAIHHRNPRNAYERSLWKHHMIHHNKNVKKNYGFSSDIWDRILGTKLK